MIAYRKEVFIGRKEDYGLEFNSHLSSSSPPLPLPPPPPSLLFTSIQVPFCALLEKILQRLIAIPESAAFRKPVQPKLVPDYYNVIRFPMDIQTMREVGNTHYIIMMSLINKPIKIEFPTLLTPAIQGKYVQYII